MIWIFQTRAICRLVRQEQHRLSSNLVEEQGKMNRGQIDAKMNYQEQLAPICN